MIGPPPLLILSQLRSPEPLENLRENTLVPRSVFWFEVLDWPWLEKHELRSSLMSDEFFSGE